MATNWFLEPSSSGYVQLTLLGLENHFSVHFHRAVKIMEIAQVCFICLYGEGPAQILIFKALLVTQYMKYGDAILYSPVAPPQSF